MPWKPTYDLHANADAARRDMARRERHSRQSGKNAKFRVVKYTGGNAKHAGKYTVEYKED